MSDECTRTYAVNPDTAEEPCEDCGRDQRKHPAPMVPIHRCASCGELVEHDKRFEPESHGDTCRQPEIRMRRLEARVYFLEQLVASLLPKDHPNARTPEPETQRSAGCPEPYTIGPITHYYWFKFAPRSTGESHPGTQPGTAEREAPAGPVPTGAAGGDSGPSPGDARPPEGGD
jgi:hypothetical protein